MILTTCAACAKPIEYDASARCVACQTRYCSDRCLRYHAHRGGHDDECEDIANGGGAEQYNADKKYEEAVADAVEQCAEDTAGQTCYICLEDGSEEGLVRGCSCRGGAGFAHVSCLAKQAKILYAEAEERHLDDDQWKRWYSCRLCEQNYHGVVACALGWACWKNYVGRPETDVARGRAISALGNGLNEVNLYEDLLTVDEARFAMLKRNGASEYSRLVVQSNLATTYEKVGRDEEALSMKRDVYSGHVKLLGEEHEHTLVAANNYAVTLRNLQHFEEAKSLLRESMPVARRVLGEDDAATLTMRWSYAQTLYEDDSATLAELREAVTTLEDTERIAQRVLGGAHPLTASIEDELQQARDALYARGLP